MDILQKHFKKGSCPYAPLDEVLRYLVKPLLKKATRVLMVFPDSGATMINSFGNFEHVDSGG